ncbi:DUF1269 domain-containing protein [Candidatus Saccharibacteria bacterium]|nr:MAG: DUF1269 domain-containing protein [Candidatus Saccharibacteria bacterium]
MHGPIDFVVVGFEGNKFNGSILKELGAALDSGVIGLVALSFVAKDDAGAVTTLDIADLGEEYAFDFAQYLPAEPVAVDQEDIAEVTDLLENNTAAGLLVIEHLWAKPLKKAIIDAGGILVADGRIHPDAAAELK